MYWKDLKGAGEAGSFQACAPEGYKTCKKVPVLLKARRIQQNANMNRPPSS